MTLMKKIFSTRKGPSGTGDFGLSHVCFLSQRDEMDGMENMLLDGNDKTELDSFVGRAPSIPMNGKDVKVDVEYFRDKRKELWDKIDKLNKMMEEL